MLDAIAALRMLGLEAGAEGFDEERMFYVVLRPGDRISVRFS